MLLNAQSGRFLSAVDTTAGTTSSSVHVFPTWKHVHSVACMHWGRTYLSSL